MRRTVVAAIVAVLLVGGAIAWFGLSQSSSSDGPVSSPSASPSPSAAGAGGTNSIRALVDARRSGVEVDGSGTVSRILSDDDDGSRHQRFILRLADGLTVLVAHNIDIAPRLDGLRVGDRVQFRGQYEWSAQGGAVHWTHHDPSGRHDDGWLRWRDRTYG